MAAPYRIAAILSRWPYPPVAGRERMLLQHLKAMLQNGRVTIFCSEDAGERPAILRDVPVVRIPRTRIVRSVWRTISRMVPFQEAYYSSDEAARILRAHHAAQPFDAVYVDMLRMAGVTRLLSRANGPRLVLDYDDRLSRRYADMMRIQGASMMGARGADFHPAVRYVSRFVSRMVLGAESWLMRKRETYWSGRVDRMLFSSRNEAREFAEEIRSSLVAGVPLLPAEQPPALPADLGDIRLVFIGNLRHTQNMEAFRSVVAHMAACASAGATLAPLHVYGRHDPMTLPSGVESFVHFHGFTETLAAVAAEPSVLVAPITFGTGIKTKVFDCMAVGIPVVTTPRGIEGLDITPGVECAVVDDPGSTYDEALAIAASPERFTAMRQASAVFIATYHHDVIADGVYRDALGFA